MSDTTKTQLDLELVRLSKRIEELVTAVDQLKEENGAQSARVQELERTLRIMQARMGEK